MRSRRVYGLVIGAVVAGCLSSTGAWAYLASTGSGSQSGSVSATVRPVTLSVGTPSAHLYPGGTADVALRASNPNSASVHLGSLALDTSQGTGGFAVDPAHSACSVSALQFTTQSNGGSGWTVPAGGNLAIDLTGAISMSSAAANACQGASFTVYLKGGS
jgi:hypothetical protein